VIYLWKRYEKRKEFVAEKYAELIIKMTTGS
jgi:hypothetical protein